MRDRLTISLVQWHAAPGEPDLNLDTALALIAEAAAQGAEWVVLPEMWASGYDGERLRDCVTLAAQPVPGARTEVLAGAAAKHGVWLFAGTVPEVDHGRIYNTAVAFEPSGSIFAKHRKVHLYPATSEETVFAAGDQVTVCDTAPFGPIGFAVCFDGDHAGYARALRDLGARIVVMPAAYEVGAESWWELLPRAHALSNGQWWVTVNQAGGYGEAAMFGRSRVIAPDGSVVCEAPRHDAGGPTVTTCTIELAAKLAQANQHSSPLWTHARPDLYTKPRRASPTECTRPPRPTE